MVLNGCENILSTNTLIVPVGYVIFYLNMSSDNKKTLLYVLSIILIGLILYHFAILLYVLVNSLITQKDEIETKPNVVSIKLSFLNLAISFVGTVFLVILLMGVG